MRGKEIFKRNAGLISVFSLTDRAEHVEIKGLKYEYEGALSNECALGVSNAFIGRDGWISVEEGALLLVYEETLFF